MQDTGIESMHPDARAPSGFVPKTGDNPPQSGGDAILPTSIAAPATERCPSSVRRGAPILTEAGASYVLACRRILEEIGEAERAATGEYATPKGELVVTASIVFGRMHVVPVVAEFLAHYPEIDINLVLTDRVVHLIDEHADVAIRIGELPDRTLMATNLGTVRRVVCASPAYLAAHGVPARTQDLAGHACITFEVFASKQAWIFGAGKSALSVPVRSRLAVNTAEAAIAAAILGVGLVRVLSYQVADALSDDALRIVLDDFESSPSPIHLVHKGQAPLPLKLRAFLDYVTPRLRARLHQA